MALDSRARASAAGMFNPIFPMGTRPNSSLDQQSRQSAGWSYSGVLAGGAIVLVVIAARVAANFIHQRNNSGTGQGVTLRL